MFETLKVEYSEKCVYDYVKIEGLETYFGVQLVSRVLYRLF